MLETLKRYLGLDPDMDHRELGKRARRYNIALVVVAVLVMLFVPSVWIRAVSFVALIALSVVVSLVGRDVERARRAQ